VQEGVHDFYYLYHTLLFKFTKFGDKRGDRSSISLYHTCGSLEFSLILISCEIP